MSYYHGPDRGYEETMEYFNSMAQYQPFKKKSFRLKKEAREWLNDFKKKNTTEMDKYKVETNFNAGDPQPWMAVILKKM